MQRITEVLAKQGQALIMCTRADPTSARENLEKISELRRQMDEVGIRFCRALQNFVDAPSPSSPEEGTFLQFVLLIFS